ncbi:hypothetical protein [Achromobacter insolitus]|uniref:hypothetical protein n=1 Tax=Achromobacter insolitus TaxID=217204 RepID=UPI00366CF70C
MGNKAKSILGTDDAWDEGILGNDAAFATRATDDEIAAVAESLAMQLISIRLPKSVIEDFKAIAAFEGVGYQPLMRIALMRFAECESKRIVREMAAQNKRARAESAEERRKRAA